MGRKQNTKQMVFGFFSEIKYFQIILTQIIEEE